MGQDEVVKSLGTSHDRLRPLSPDKSRDSSENEEDKLEASRFSDRSQDEIRLFNDKNNQLKSKKSEIRADGRDSITRDSLLNELK